MICGFVTFPKKTMFGLTKDLYKRKGNAARGAKGSMLWFTLREEQRTEGEIRN